MHYFQLSSADEVPNWSEISNIASERTLCVGDEHWDFASMYSDDMQVRAATIWNGALVVVHRDRGLTRPGAAQRWNGSSWETLGTFTGGIGGRSVAVFNGDLIVGGSFESVSGTAANNIAAYDGTTWSSLGSGLTWQLGADNTPAVLALAVFQGQLIAAGGDISHAGGVPVMNIARWTGSAWQSMPSLPTASVGALAVHDGSLFAGTHRGIGSDLTNVYRWNGSSWEAIGTGMDGPPLALITDGTGLIAAGSFSHIGGITAAVARWNGSSWAALGSGDWGSEHIIRALSIYEGDLIAGGEFTLADGTPASGIARWDGGAWHRMGCPPLRPAPSAAGFDVYFLGTLDGGLAAGYYDGVARWTD
jgi:hypothetical protein